MQKVNLIVNVFNGETYLEKTLKSLLAQDYPHLDIHCFNNHSTDRTEEIIERFLFEFQNVFGYTTPVHMPLVEARLYAISTIKKKNDSYFYFGFCDADDWWEPKWLSKMMCHSDLGYDLLICNGYGAHNGKNTPIDSCMSMYRPSPFICPVAFQSCLFNSRILSDQALFDRRFPFAYDLEFWVREGPKLSYMHISDRLFYYRIHSDSACNRNFWPILRERWRMLKRHRLSKVRFAYGLFRQLLNMANNRA